MPFRAFVPFRAFMPSRHSCPAANESGSESEPYNRRAVYPARRASYRSTIAGPETIHSAAQGVAFASTRTSRVRPAVVDRHLFETIDCQTARDTVATSARCKSPHLARSAQVGRLDRSSDSLGRTLRAAVLAIPTCALVKTHNCSRRDASRIAKRGRQAAIASRGCSVVPNSERERAPG